MKYPCKDCKKKSKKKSKYCYCKEYKDWFGYQWNKEVEPFRKIKEQRDRQKQK